MENDARRTQHDHTRTELIRLIGDLLIEATNTVRGQRNECIWKRKCCFYLSTSQTDGPGDVSGCEAAALTPPPSGCFGKTSQTGGVTWFQSADSVKEQSKPIVERGRVKLQRLMNFELQEMGVNEI